MPAIWPPRSKLAIETHRRLTGSQHQRRSRVGLDLLRLSAPVIGVEHEPALVDPLEQHHARRGPAVPRGRGQRHRVRLQHLGVPRFGEPPLELPHRILIDVRLAQRGAGVVTA